MCGMRSNTGTRLLGRWGWLQIRKGYMMNFEHMENRQEQMLQDNEMYLTIFRTELETKGLTEKTIDRHLHNASFYINDFLPRERTLMKDGCDYISEFLGHFFIEKCIWATPAAMRTMAASLKKFYRCMRDHGKVASDDYEELCDSIRFSMDEWQEEYEKFNRD